MASRFLRPFRPGLSDLRVWNPAISLNWLRYAHPTPAGFLLASSLPLEPGVFHFIQTRPAHKCSLPMNEPPKLVP